MENQIKNSFPFNEGRKKRKFKIDNSISFKERYKIQECQEFSIFRFIIWRTKEKKPNGPKSIFEILSEKRKKNFQVSRADTS